MMIDKLEQKLIAAGDETHRHCIGVEGITRILLMNDGRYSEDEMKRIQTAARYHDVGKSEIDKDVLYANRRLSDEEFKTIKSHPVIGSSIIESTSDIDKATKDTILQASMYHHQRIDGKGYPPVSPDFVMPKEIETIAMADVFEALTAKRSYKEPFPPETAFNMIMDGKCGEFSQEAKNNLENSFAQLAIFVQNHNCKGEALKGLIEEMQLRATDKEATNQNITAPSTDDLDER
jgi:HD-GYP domain-containing protein (c-di-GMP phosphodiesterase class II)